MKHICFCLLTILFLCSCEEISNVPDTGRKLVINGIITNDNMPGINITNSMYISDSSEWLGDNKITNAEVLIYENMSIADTLKILEDYRLDIFNYFKVPNNYGSANFKPVSGKEYKITVKSPGYPEASAATIIPNQVKIDKLDTVKVVLPGTFYEWESNIRLHCNLKFTDPPNEKNYYLIFADIKTNDFDPDILEFECTDPVVEEEINHGTIMFGVAFSDKNINGAKCSLPLIFNGKLIGWPYFNDFYTPDPIYRKVIYIKLYSITEEYYKYIHSLNLFLEKINDPLSEPVQVYSNINGGYGIFAGAAVSCDSIVFQP